MCNKAVNTYSSTKKFAFQCFMTQEIRDKAVNRCYFVRDCFPNQCKTQKMCNSNISEDLFSVGDVPDQCKTQKYVTKLLMIV